MLLLTALCRPIVPEPYHKPSTRCSVRLTIVMAIQQTNPSAIGLPPVLTSFTTSVFIPIAAIAITIKNLLSCFRRLKISLAAARAVPEQKEA